MRMPALILTVMAATLLIAPARSEDKVKELQKERIAALEEAADQLTKLFENARATFDEVCEARLLALHAKLDAAENMADRIKLYEQVVDVMVEYEKWAQGKVVAGRAIKATYLKVKARRLEGQIAWERAKAKAAKNDKK